MQEGASIYLGIRLGPRAGQDRIVGWSGGEDSRLVVRVTAPPSQGEANDALIRLLASDLRISKSRISLVRGLRQRDKLLLLDIDSQAYEEWARSLPLIKKE